MRRAKATRRDERASVPAGWSYNPSSWGQRWLSLVVSMLAFAAMLHVARFEWGQQRLHAGMLFDSGLVGFLPTPFAKLSAALYLLAALTGALGGACRWRTLPWVVILFGVCVGSLTLVNVALMILQPLLLGTCSTICLGSTLLSMSMVAPALEEVLATSHHLQRTARCGGSPWRAFWGSGVHLRWPEPA